MFKRLHQVSLLDLASLRINTETKNAADRQGCKGRSVCVCKCYNVCRFFLTSMGASDHQYSVMASFLMGVVHTVIYIYISTLT